MAESVQYYLERMIPELEGLEKKHIFTPVEIKSIIKKRTNFEYALQRRIKKKIDFLRAIEYEMNLEELRKKRIGKMGIMDSLKGDDLQYSGARRIYSLFKRATIKFTGDISLWLQYIDYAKQNKANNILSSIFVQAIQYHPKNASLWIMAATWENEHNSNTAAARVLMQRAIRLMPENQQLWHEYFRLELLYIEKIKLRRRILGINQQKNQEPTQEQPEEEDDNTIQLPAITGEDMEAFKEENTDKKKSKLTEEQMASLEQENNPILQGLLAKIIYDNAITSIPQDLTFRTRFIEIYREFTDTQSHIEHVYETIRRDLSDVAEARAYLATRHLGTLTISDPAFIPALKQCVDEFEQALGDGLDMWELYVVFLLGWHTLVSEPNLKLYLTKLLEKTFKKCDRKSARMYELWTQFLITEKQEQKAERVASQGVNAFPKSALLWTYLVELNIKDIKQQQALFKDALEENPDSLLLWTTYKDWIVNSNSGDADTLLFKANEMATLLLPAVTAENQDRNRIKDLLQASYVEWAVQVHGIDAFRSVYQKIIKNFYPTYTFFVKCIEIENQYGSGDHLGQESVEYLYERLTRLDENKQESFIGYLAFLYSQKKLQKANQIYNRACKELENNESFDNQVQKLRNQHSTL